MDNIRPVVSPSNRWDDNTKTRFKWMFYRLVVELNIIILLVAISVLIFFLIHSSYTVPCIVVMLALALVISLDFKKKYQETKVWLDENTRNKTSTEDGH
ncbi:MAG: hypothetical protein LUQ19_04265 [Methanoregula sp.]|nr:hypothetical protein [Methanoregula sp.]